MKLTIFKHVAVLSGTGGGSSVYANTLPIPNLHFSAGVNHDLENELAPYKP
jgi:4-diphosphocytidyl-2C-methyl-D-erythritol kinase